jgi:hypothetical protein
VSPISHKNSALFYKKRNNSILKMNELNEIGHINEPLGARLSKTSIESRDICDPIVTISFSCVNKAFITSFPAQKLFQTFTPLGQFSQHLVFFLT